MMLAKMQSVIKRLSPTAKAFLPGGLTEILLEMAEEIDRLRAENNQLKEGKKT